MWNSKRLVLAHFWFAFAGFGAALLLGEWQMFVRSPLQRLDQRSGAVLSLGDRAWHGRWPMYFRRSSRWASATR